MNLGYLFVQRFLLNQAITIKDAFGEIVDGDTNWYANMTGMMHGLTSLGGEVSPDGLEFYGWEPLHGMMISQCHMGPS